MAEKIDKMECKTIARMPQNKVLIHFSLYMQVSITPYSTMKT